MEKKLGLSRSKTLTSLSSVLVFHYIIIIYMFFCTAVCDSVTTVRDSVTAVCDSVTAVRDSVKAVCNSVTAVRDSVTTVRDSVTAVRDPI